MPGFSGGGLALPRAPGGLNSGTPSAVRRAMIDPFPTNGNQAPKKGEPPFSWVIFAGVCVLVAVGSVYLLTGMPCADESDRAGADLKTLGIALHSYANTNGNYPTQQQGLHALIEFPRSGPTPERWRQYLEEEMRDPWGEPYHYRLPSRDAGRAFDLWSSGPDRRSGTDDDIANGPDVAME